MRRLSLVLMSALVFAAPLSAQQTCGNYSVVINSPEDKLTMAINDADTPQEQVKTIQAFLQQHADSKFVPCAYQSLTKAYLKMKDYSNAIAAGQKAVAANYLDAPFLRNLLQAYVEAGEASDDAFAVINKGAAAIKEQSVVARPMKATDAEYQQMQKQAEAGAEGERQYMEYAFFQLLPRVQDPAKRVATLDQFSQTYPDAVQKNAGWVNSQYATAYSSMNQTAKADEYAEKTVAADPSNVEALNMLALDYSIVRQDKKLDAAAADAQKVIDLVPNMKAPAGTTAEQFKPLQDNLLGSAHLCLGYIHLYRASSGKHYSTHSQMAPAIKELKDAIGLLANKPELQGGAYFYLGTAYEEEYPAEHHEALEAFSKSAELQGPWKASAESSLAKVKRAVQ